jgi:hypothetical protein
MLVAFKLCFQKFVAKRLNFVFVGLEHFIYPLFILNEVKQANATYVAG